jgi:hypothetical protein
LLYRQPFSDFDLSFCYIVSHFAIVNSVILATVLSHFVILSTIEDATDVIHPTCTGGGGDAEEEGAYGHDAAKGDGSA